MRKRNWHYWIWLMGGLLLACTLPTWPFTPAGDRGAQPGGDRGFSRSLPHPYGEPLQLSNWELQVEELVAGDAAQTLLRETNSRNSPAEAGWEYVLLKVRLRSLHPAGEELIPYSLQLTGEQGKLWSRGGAVPPEPRLSSDFYGGEENLGWVVFLTPEGEGNRLLVFQELFAEDRSHYYVQLEEGARVFVDLSLRDIQPTDAGTTPKRAVALGEPITTESWQVTVLEVLRGEPAWEALFEAHRYNSPPEPGMEYLLVSVHVRYIGLEEGPAVLFESDYEVLGSDNVVFRPPSLVEPEPAYRTSLYPGGTHTGWIGLEVDAAAERPLLVFRPSSDRQQQRYLALTPGEP